MGEVNEMPESLASELDNSFSGEDRAMMFLNLSNVKFTMEVMTIKLKEIGASTPMKAGRLKTVSGLTQSIKELGVLTPIHVMKVSDESQSDDYRYQLMDGLRRMFGATKNGLSEIKAIVWTFEDPDKARDLILFISLMLNHYQQRHWEETWGLYEVLEMLNSSISPRQLEYYLNLNSGDAMKLKDVMKCDYEEVREALLNNEKDLEGCYRMLQKLRKDEDKLAMDDQTGISHSGVDGVEDVVNNPEKPLPTLTDDDVLELLEMADSSSLAVTDGDFDALNNADDAYTDQQRVGERHELDKVIRARVLDRDKYTCGCCSLEMGIARLGITAVHHKIPVHCGGKDFDENLITLCLNCHITLHVAERNGGKLQISKAEFESKSDTDQKALMKILSLAKVAVEADKRKGFSKEDVKKHTSDSIRHPMPGMGLKETTQMYANSNTRKSLTS